MDTLKPGDPVKVGSYRLIGRLGEGGMGRVFLGLSPGGRQVAVKIIHAGHASDRQFRERFAREIEAARRVGGFHTASVVDADPSADPPWMVTAYIHGRSLQETVSADGPLGPDQVCTLGAALAEGLGAIHACGLVHRDLKPSNVILAEDGPRIIDFGIARATGASRMTTAGVVIGTISYMSPEQVMGAVAGPASDVFALGCTLAYAATGCAPFGDESIVTVAHRIVSEPPDMTGVPEEHGLRQLIGECLAKSPDDRPTLSAILARLTETGEDLAAAEPAPGDMPTVQAPPAAMPPPPAQTPPPVAAPPGDPLVPQWPSGYAGHLPPTAGGLADRTPPAGPDQVQTQTIGGGDHGVLGRATAPPPYGAQPGGADMPVWGPGAGTGPGPGRRRPSRRVIIGASAAVVVLLAAVLGIVLGTGGHKKPAPIASVRSSPHPTPSASTTTPPPTQPLATLRDPKGKIVFGLAFSSNTMLATGDSNGSSYLWDLSTGKLKATLRGPGSYSVNGLAYSRRSDTLAAADATGEIYLWNASTGKLTATLKNPAGKANDSVEFSPDGGFVAAGNENGSTYLWNVAAGKLDANPSRALRDPGGKSVYGIAFNPDGGLLAAGDTNGSVYLWNVATGALTATFRNPNSGGLYDVAFSPDGRLVAVSDTQGANGPGVVYLWNVATGKIAKTLTSLDGGAYSDVAFSRDGRVIATADTDGSIIMWNVATGAFIANLPDPAGQSLVAIAFSPDGHTVATTDTTGDTFVWDAKWLGT